MVLKNILDDDFVNYKVPSMILVFPTCDTFKCGKAICQNSDLISYPDIVITPKKIVDRYMNNHSAHALVCSGLEPLDSWEDVQEFVQKFREKTDDDIVIYTGYNKCEIGDKIRWLGRYKNIVVKYGRFIPNQKPHYDGVLGVDLASDNQYAERIS